MRIKLIVLLNLFFFLCADSPIHAGVFIEKQGTDFLSFDELVQLYNNPEPEGDLKAKLDNFWQTPIISNEAYYQGVMPHKPFIPEIGNSLNVTSWNIEKSLHIDNVLKLVDSKFTIHDLISKDGKKNRKLFRKIFEQHKRLMKSDILILQEMDIGNKRSGYVDAAQVLAEKLKMNYAYAPSQLEIDPALLAKENILLEDGTLDTGAMDHFQVDPARYKGVFGSAVLSRYPIKYAEVFQLENQAYDWYHQEKEKISFLEHARRLGAKWTIQNEITREIKVGGRIFFRVDLHVPHLPDQTLTIINVHLEIKSLPKGREKQIKEILEYIRPIQHPVIMMGDFNAAPTDISPTNVGRVVKRSAMNPTTWLHQAINYLSPQALVINTTRTTTNYTKNLENPLASDIPVIAPNPVKDMFERIRDFRFTDGGQFDFRGDKERSEGRYYGVLSNSNQHDLKGFRVSFRVKRPILTFGKYRLDWAFVKVPAGMKSDNRYRFAPHFGETLTELNLFLENPVSDHDPISVSLPFHEPRFTKKKKKNIPFIPFI